MYNLRQSTESLKIYNQVLTDRNVLKLELKLLYILYLKLLLMYN